jgi:hypothetical protein
MTEEEQHCYEASTVIMKTLVKGMPMLTHTAEQATFLAMLTADIYMNLQNEGFFDARRGDR